MLSFHDIEELKNSLSLHASDSRQGYKLLTLGCPGFDSLHTLVTYQIAFLRSCGDRALFASQAFPRPFLLASGLRTTHL